ncbi:NADP-dependent oxidoreductase [Acinetobacter gerneri]|uniref:Enoyl reductase (ER) domain-containing protein n=1 Tax=Acinetobacter gerneri DSM 14967 = CIP 107464 = MTCC 9824 TaxID=1120926 RepID=N8ZJB7_9GAMM|nr:NADP-dependent oxidoreductase [Acinetobacter gerneri]ENV33854.1 hypothetical protein F960_01860 [Acinetobacter gerneri DSM 14967 = CIP 107464 = MTCC 9824]EPR81243.1 oxidoreductase [Acinetobacter gerneri DSM 14967 = CIP 107464 = MTCC 9824]
MKAIQFDHYGDVDVLEINEVAMPIPNDEQVLIKIKAFGINPLDWKLRAGIMQHFFTLNFPHLLGAEFAGVISKIGKNVTQFKVGDHVYGRANHTYAQYSVAHPSSLQIIPEFLDFAQAASLPSGSQIAYSALSVIGQIKKGQDVLIHAGAGSVGSNAIQIAKKFGANITTTVSENNLNLAKKLGADHIIDYKKTKLQHIDQRFDLILDTVGGQTQIDSWELLKDQGTLVTLVSDEREHFKTPKKDQNYYFMHGIQGNIFNTVHQMIVDRDIQPVIDHIYDFKHIADAQKRSQNGHLSGKIVVTI